MMTTTLTTDHGHLLHRPVARLEAKLGVRTAGDTVARALREEPVDLVEEYAQ